MLLQYACNTDVNYPVYKRNYLDKKLISAVCFLQSFIGKEAYAHCCLNVFFAEKKAGYPAPCGILQQHVD